MTAVVVSVKKNGLAIVEYAKPSHAVSIIIVSKNLNMKQMKTLITGVESIRTEKWMGKIQ